MTSEIEQLAKEIVLLDVELRKMRYLQNVYWGGKSYSQRVLITIRRNKEIEYGQLYYMLHIPKFQLSRALRDLVASGQIVRIRSGLYGSK